jgi:hypothetical protein
LISFGKSALHLETGCRAHRTGHIAPHGCLWMDRTGTGNRGNAQMGNRLRVFFIEVPRSRQQPSAALRWGALRAAAGRPCLGTSCFGGSSSQRLFGVGERGCLVPLTPAAFGCAPLGRTSCGGQSALPQHFRASEEYPKSVVQKSRTRPDGPRAGQARPRGAQPTGCWRERYKIKQKTPHSFECGVLCLTPHF